MVDLQIKQEKLVLVDVEIQIILLVSVWYGGISGWIRTNGKVTLSCNLGIIKSTGYDSETYSRLGGIVGQCGDAEISYCYNRGEVNAACRGNGGILGGTGGAKTVLKYCYNTGNLYNSNSSYNGKTGGIIGTKYTITTALNISNCWQLENCIKTGQDNENLCAVEKTESELKAITWENFTIDSSKNDGYPILSWEKE